LIAKLASVAKEVKGKLEEVTKATLAKLDEMNSEIAQSLNPSIPDVEL